MGTQGYVPLNGTSMACPHVAGVAALWWQAMVQAGLDPNPARVAGRLQTACRLGDLGAGARDRVDIGEGLVQAPTAPLRA
jgi:subtilisin family serine protease